MANDGDRRTNKVYICGPSLFCPFLLFTLSQLLAFFIISFLFSYFFPGRIAFSVETTFILSNRNETLL